MASVTVMSRRLNDYRNAIPPAPVTTGGIRSDICSASLIGSLPTEENFLREAILNKLNFGHDWVPQRIVITERILYITAPNDDNVKDLIPLDEVLAISRMTSSAKSNDDGEWRKVVKGVSDQYPFDIKTEPKGYNAGRSYVFSLETEDARDEWVKYLIATAYKAKRIRIRGSTTKFDRFQLRVKRVYDSRAIQNLVAILIVGNFVANIMQAEMNPSDGSNEQNGFDSVDFFFTVIFAVELCVNMFSNWFWPFFTNSWSLFDLIVVMTSVISLGVGAVPGLSTLRLMRAFRALRLFGRLKSLRKIIDALVAAVKPVSNALLIMGLVNAIYAILAVNLYGEKEPQYFGYFFRSYFSMFQISSGEGWSAIARSLFPDSDGSLDAGAICFFASVQVIMGWTLIQVVTALLIEAFTKAALTQKMESLRKKADRANRYVESHPLDPILAAISHFESAEDLSQRIYSLFTLLDSNGSGSLTATEFVESLQKLKVKPTIYVSEEDFLHMTKHRTLCADDGGINFEGFDKMMREQLKLFLQRQLAYALSVSDQNSPFGAVFLLLKYFTENVLTLAELYGSTTMGAAPKPEHPIEKGSNIQDRVANLKLKVAGLNKSVEQQRQTIERILSMLPPRTKPRAPADSDAQSLSSPLAADFLSHRQLLSPSTEVDPSANVILSASGYVADLEDKIKTAAATGVDAKIDTAYEQQRSSLPDAEIAVDKPTQISDATPQNFYLDNNPAVENSRGTLHEEIVSQLSQLSSTPSKIRDRIEKAIQPWAGDMLSSRLPK